MTFLSRLLSRFAPIPTHEAVCASLRVRVALYQHDYDQQPQEWQDGQDGQLFLRRIQNYRRAAEDLAHMPLPDLLTHTFVVTDERGREVGP